MTGARPPPGAKRDERGSRMLPLARCTSAEVITSTKATCSTSTVPGACLVEPSSEQQPSSARFLSASTLPTLDASQSPDSPLTSSQATRSAWLRRSPHPKTPLSVSSGWARWAACTQSDSRAQASVPGASSLESFPKCLRADPARQAQDQRVRPARQVRLARRVLQGSASLSRPVGARVRRLTRAYPRQARTSSSPSGTVTSSRARATLSSTRSRPPTSTRSSPSTDPVRLSLPLFAQGQTVELTSRAQNKPPRSARSCRGRRASRRRSARRSSSTCQPTQPSSRSTLCTAPRSRQTGRPSYALVPRPPRTREHYSS